MKQNHLYGGSEIVLFDEENHEYYWQNKKMPGNTSICNIRSKGDKLIEWALDQGERYLLSRWDDETIETEVGKAALMRGMKKAWIEARKFSASVGTTAHKWIEDHIKASITMDREPDWPDIDAAHRAAESYLAWENNHSVRYVSSEKLVLSREHGYCGTEDIVAYVDDSLTLVDIKTGNNYRSDYAMQTAGYLIAENEERRCMGEEEVKERIILVVSKEDAAFMPFRLPESRNERDQAAFLGAKQLYDWTMAEGISTGEKKKRRRK